MYKEPSKPAFVGSAKTFFSEISFDGKVKIAVKQFISACVHSNVKFFSHLIGLIRVTHYVVICSKILSFFLLIHLSVFIVPALSQNTCRPPGCDPTNDVTSYTLLSRTIQQLSRLLCFSNSSFEIFICLVSTIRKMKSSPV